MRGITKCCMHTARNSPAYFVRYRHVLALMPDVRVLLVTLVHEAIA